MCLLIDVQNIREITHVLYYLIHTNAVNGHQISFRMLQSGSNDTSKNFIYKLNYKKKHTSYFIGCLTFSSLHGELVNGKR